MLSLTKKTEYALIAMCYLWERRNQTVSAREIAEAFSMPLSLMMNILKTLHHSELLSSSRGTKGGYRLTGDLSKISLHKLIEDLEGPVRLTECSDAEDPREIANRACRMNPGCPIQKPLHALHGRMVSFLKDVKLSDIIGPGNDAPAELVGNARACAHASA